MSAVPSDLDRRFYAFVLDRLVIWSLDAAAILLSWYLLPAGAAIAVSVAAVLVVGGGFAVLLGLTGTSPGNAALGVRVLAAGTAEPIGVRRALLRQLVLGVATLPTFGLGVATLAWTAAMDPSGRRHGWHDRLTGSEVLDVRPVPGEPEVEEPSTPQVVNLTAMRLVPASALPPPPTLPPPSAPPRQQLGYPLLPDAPEPSRGWRLSFDSGESFVLEGLALVGRRPEARAGEAVRHLVPLESSDMSLSKTHAQVQLVDGNLVVTDRGSTNGSFLLRQGAARELSPGRPTTLLEGDHVRFGDREMTVLRDA